MVVSNLTHIGMLPEQITQWRRDALQGYAEAQFNLGAPYADDICLRQDYAEEAIQWYRLAAQQGDAKAQSALER